MSLWKTLGEFAWSLEQLEATQRKRKAEKRKQRLEEMKYTFANLVTLKEFRSRMTTLVSGIDQLFAVTGELIVQRVTDRMIHATARYTSDLTGVFSLKLDDVVDKLKDFISRGENLMQTKIEGTIRALLEGHEKALTHQHYATSTQIAVVGQRVQQNDIHLTEHKVEMLQRFQDATSQANRNTDILLGMMQSLFDQVALVKDDSPQPSLTWLAENSDAIIVYGEALKNLRDGVIPASAAMVQAVKAIRTLLNVDMKIAKAALDVQAELWGVGEIELAQAA